MAKKGKKLSRAEKERKKELKKQRVMSLVLVFIMVGGLAGVATFNMTGNNGQVSQIGEYDVTVGQHEDFYNREYQSQVLFLHVDDSTKIPFYNYPQAFTQFDSQGNMTELLDDANTVILSGAGKDQMESQLLDLLRYEITNNAPATVIGAVPENMDSSNLPVATCDNATTAQPVVMLEVANETTFTRTGSCVEITFIPQHTHYVRDKLLYNLYGVDV